MADDEDGVGVPGNCCFSESYHVNVPVAVAVRADVVAPRQYFTSLTVGADGMAFTITVVVAGTAIVQPSILTYEYDMVSVFTSVAVNVADTSSIFVAFVHVPVPPAGLGVAVIVVEVKLQIEFGEAVSVAVGNGNTTIEASPLPSH